MTTWTDLYSKPRVIQTHWFNMLYDSNTSGRITSFNLTGPVGARAAIIKAVAAGGWGTSPSYNTGGGAVLAITKLTDLVDNETFTIQVGDTNSSLNAGDSLGNSIVTRTTSGSTIVCLADRGKSNANGLASNSVGNIARREGATFGVSGTDIADRLSHGFNGRSVRVARAPGAAPGGGGIYNVTYDSYGNSRAFYPGSGRVMIQFWTKDMGIIV